MVSIVIRWYMSLSLNSFDVHVKDYNILSNTLRLHINIVYCVIEVHVNIVYCVIYVYVHTDRCVLQFI